MKLKYLVGIGMACSMICSCSEEYMSFEGTDRIQFKTKTEEVYTFAYYPESIQKDTLQIELISVGEVTDYPRVIRFEQVTKEWKYTYDEEEDTGLRKNARKLVLRLLPSDDFQTGEVNKLVKNITISDKLERPTRWKDNSYYYKLYLGNWSEVKHRFMIDITGQKWDNDFLVYIIDNYDTYSLRDYYLAKIKKALAEYNADPKNDPPLKDENGKEVVFP